MVVSIESGTLRRRIAIQRSSGSRNSFGVIPPSFSTIATRWAAKSATSGSEEQQADKTEARSKVTWELRYYGGLTTEDQFVWDSRTFRIVAINDVDGMNVKHIVDTVEVG